MADLVLNSSHAETHVILITSYEVVTIITTLYMRKLKQRFQLRCVKSGSRVLAHDYCAVLSCLAREDIPGTTHLEKEGLLREKSRPVSAEVK